MNKYSPLLKKTLKIVSRTILVLITLISLYLLSAFILSRITVEAEKNTKEEVEIFILTNGVHTDIVVPTSNNQYNWKDKVNHLTDTSDYKYLAIGWGDKGFYLNTPTWADLKFSTAFNAGFGLSSTAIHATYHTEMLENDSCKRIQISKKQYRRLITYISKSFQNNKNGTVIQINTSANYSDTDAFYEANGTYSFFQTCNSWANNGLKSCGQKACLWTAFHEGIFLKYE